MSRIEDTVSERQKPADTAVRQEGQQIASSAREQVDLAHLKVAIVHDWLVGGGAEKVVLELHKMFPDAPVYTSYSTDEWRKRLDGKVVTGWLQHFGKLRKFMVVGRIWWFGRLKLDDYDLVITSSGNGEAFAIKTGSATMHINYCHSPTHYYWRHYDQYMARPGFGVFNPLARLGLKLLVGPLRRWDYKAAQRADIILANSTHIQSDIKQYYRRDSTVVFPPVNTVPFNDAQPQKRAGYLSLGRQVPQKFVNIIVDACTQLNLPLTVAGNGPEHANLEKLAGPTVQFDDSKFPDSKVIEYMASAEAFVFSSLEDFGIAPVEAMAAGTPVIAYKAGGALDYVVPGITGEFFDEQTADSLVAALQVFDPRKYNSDDIKTAAQKFSTEEFHKNIRTVLENVLQ
jgi:glycosyltransferase involved in cell wall biosynthesis